MDIGSVLISLAVILYIIFIIRYVISIILDYDNCNPIKTIGWILAIVLIPVIGILLYIVIGRNLNKKRSYFKRLSKEVKKHGEAEYGFERIDEYPEEMYGRLKKLLVNPYHLPVFPGNKIDFFSNGQDKFDSLFADIERAQKHINIYYYTLGDDNIGQQLKDLLIKKSKENVEIRLMYDDIGSNETSKSFFQEMQSAGIRVVTFSPVKFPRLLKSINYRNHKKIVVIDGIIGYTGGMNVKDEYIEGVDWGVWKDVHLRIMGPGAQGLQTIFFIDWFFECNEYLMNNKEFYPKIDYYGDNALQVVTAEPIGEFGYIMMGMVEAIMNAKKSVYIESPYFVPTESMINAIQTAGLSGVEVHVILPDKSDNPKVQYATNSYIQQLLSAHVNVHRYENGFIHSKLMVIDDEIVIAGSSNMDIRSFELNFEANVFIYNKESALKAKSIIMKDIEKSKTIEIDAWMNRRKREIFKESFFRLFSPLM